MWSDSESLLCSGLQQLRANVREMEQLCARVRAEDAAALEALVQPTRDRAAAAVRDFLLLHSRPVSQPATPPATAQTSSCAAAHHGGGGGDGGGGEEEEPPTAARQNQLQLPEIPADESAAESWDNLEEVSRWRPRSVATPCFRLEERF